VSKYAGISLRDSDGLTRKDLEILVEELKDWLETESQSKVKRDESFLKAIAKIVQSVFSGR